MTEKVAVIVHLCQTQVQPAQEKMKLTYGVNQLRAAMILCAEGIRVVHRPLRQGQASFLW